MWCPIRRVGLAYLSRTALRSNAAWCRSRPGSACFGGLGLVTVWVLSWLTPTPLAAQPLRSPELQADGQVRFRCRAPTAARVRLIVPGRKPVPMAAVDDRGVFTVTQSLPAGIHAYLFEVDGVRQLDLHNRWIQRWRSLVSLVEVPDREQPRLTERQSVPHGSLHRHWYRSAGGVDRPVVVYTPPGYEDSGEQRYPLMVLLHGNGDDEGAWVDVGRAHCIFDNLLAAGEEAKPMVVAMPYGHPLPLPNGARVPDYGRRNNAAMAADVVDSLLPFLERRYRLAAGSEQRAVVGLSMGGGQALHIGLRHPDRFGWVGAFSAAPPSVDLGEEYGERLSAERRALWIRCGVKDFLLQRNRKFLAALGEAGVACDYAETEGGHAWPVWRRYLPAFCRLVFSGS